MVYRLLSGVSINTLPTIDLLVIWLTIIDIVVFSFGVFFWFDKTDKQLFKSLTLKIVIATGIFCLFYLFLAGVVFKRVLMFYEKEAAKRLYLTARERRLNEDELAELHSLLDIKNIAPDIYNKKIGGWEK